MILGWPLRVFVAVVLFAVAMTPHRRAAASECRPLGGGAPLRVLVDPRVELMSIVFRLAGHPEYSMGRIEAYASDVDAHFAPFKDHAVVARARALRRARGISYNAPMSLAVHVTNPPGLQERVPLDPLPPGVDPRWSPSEARAFLADLRQFVRDADVMTFLGRHESLYRTAAARLDGMVREKRIREWFDGFFGGRQGTDFILIGALLNGGGNYGAFARGVRRVDDTPTGPERQVLEEFFAILGTEAVDADGLPSYPPRLAGTIVHEFAHSFVTPLVDTHFHKLEAVTARLFALVEEQMRSQAYGVPKALLYESLVRASTVRYLSVADGIDAAGREAVASRENGFLWVGKLADELREYEGNRSRYPTLDAFVPRLVAFFEAYSATAAQDLETAQAERHARNQALSARGPKVVSFSPANGAADVDSSTVTTIVITFDRPMRPGNFALVAIPDAAILPATGRPQFAGRVVTLPCRLNPGITYGAQLNSAEHMAFADEQGNPLAPVGYRFTTRK